MGAPTTAPSGSARSPTRAGRPRTPSGAWGGFSPDLVGPLGGMRRLGEKGSRLRGFGGSHGVVGLVRARGAAARRRDHGGDGLLARDGRGGGDGDGTRPDALRRSARVDPVGAVRGARDRVQRAVP